MGHCNKKQQELALSDQLLSEFFNPITQIGSFFKIKFLSRLLHLGLQLINQFGQGLQGNAIDIVIQGFNSLARTD